MAERLAAAAKGSEPAPEQAAVDLTALAVAHYAAVYRYACRLCGCRAEAEDLTQQTFLIARRKLDQLRDPERACAWLLAVVRSCFLKGLRKSRPLPMANVELVADRVAASTPAVEEIDRERLDAALAELPDDFRLVLVMFYFEDLSYQQIAEELEIPIGTVMSRLSRAKGHLRRRLAPAEQDQPPITVFPKAKAVPGAPGRGSVPTRGRST